MILLGEEMVIWDVQVSAGPALLLGLALLLVVSAVVGLTVWLLMRRRQS
ncbi:MAG: hypothetical protein ACYSXF_08420 [Planctomycetota bacterium]